MKKLLAIIFFLCSRLDAFVVKRHGYVKIAVENAVDKASMRILKDVYEESEDKNVITSPIGVFMLLSLYSTATNGTSRDEILQLLGFPEYDQMTTAYTFLSKRFTSMEPKLMTLANKVCVSDKYELTDEFSTAAIRRYHSDIDNLDFNDGDAAANRVNEWADLKTRGNIRNPVTKDTFSHDTSALLVNIIYFQGNWTYPFDAEYTVEKRFHVSKTKSIMKPTMNLYTNLLYHENEHLGARIIQLPYNDSDFSMIVVLPDEVDGLPKMLQKLAAQSMLRDIVEKMSDREVFLEIPKFEIKSTINLNDVLKKEGVRGIFTTDTAGVIKGGGVRVSQVSQEAFVKVDESGTTAGAFTYAKIHLRCGDDEWQPPVEFKVDRPFLYAILHQDIVLFAGTHTH